jgi:hypothetical protein
MDPGEWLSFTGFMNANRVLSLNTPEAAFTNEFLPEPAE